LVYQQGKLQGKVTQMEINEFSRFDQLVGNGAEIIAKAMVAYGIDMESLIGEISETVKGVSAEIASESGDWYNVANEFASELAEEFHTTPEIAAGIISAVSPRMPWKRNKTVARAILQEFKKYPFLSAMDAAKEIGMALSANVSMAVKIARKESISETLSGVKRRSFFNNISSPNGIDSVTVDTWMMVAYCNVTGADKKTAEKFIAANRTALGGAGAGYYAIAEAVRMVAKELGMTANAVQAIYWCQVSGSFDGSRTDIN
jgi:hypothetical protein